jgi:hypothetical protein
MQPAMSDDQPKLKWPRGLTIGRFDISNRRRNWFLLTAPLFPQTEAKMSNPSMLAVKHCST